jgi:hypothetical protein
MLGRDLELLSTITIVVVVGSAAAGMLVADLVARELHSHPPPSARHYRGVGLSLTFAFVVLVIARFVALGA